MLMVSAVSASDSLRTVAEFGRKVFHNLNFADTLNGSDRFDSVDAHRYVRDAVRAIRYPKSKSVTLVDGTFSYLLDKQMTEVNSALSIYNNTANAAKVVPFEKFQENFNMTATTWDSLSVDMVSWFGDSVYVYPIPVGPGSLLVYYTVHGPNYAASSDTVNISVEFYEEIEYWSTAHAALSLGMMNEFSRFMELYIKEHGE